jgi:hypothetical protein
LLALATPCTEIFKRNHPSSAEYAVDEKVEFATPFYSDFFNIPSYMTFLHRLG